MSKNVKASSSAASKITKKNTNHRKIEIIQVDSDSVSNDIEDEDDDDIQNIQNIDIRGERINKKHQMNQLKVGNALKELPSKKTKKDSSTSRNRSIEDKTGKKIKKEIVKYENVQAKTVLSNSRERINKGDGDKTPNKGTKKGTTPEKENKKNGNQCVEMLGLFKYDLEDTSAQKQRTPSKDGSKKKGKVQSQQRNGIKQTDIEEPSLNQEDNSSLLEANGSVSNNSDQQDNKQSQKFKLSMVRRSSRVNGVPNRSQDKQLTRDENDDEEDEEEEVEQEEEDTDEIVLRVKDKKEGINTWNSGIDATNNRRNIINLESPIKPELEKRRSITKASLNGQDNKEIITKENATQRKLRSGNSEENYQNGSFKEVDIEKDCDKLMDIGKIDEEMFEVSELPKDKTRVLWIINSVIFIERLMSKDEDARKCSVFTTSNGKKWQLEVSQNGKEQQIDCVLRRVFADSDSAASAGLKQQMYYVFKFFSLGNSDPIIDKTYSASKTFSADSPSQAFNFPFDVELILDKYQHIVFELTLTPQRLLNYNSKEETGYVGLQNEGMTCYMNSFLQTVFHIKAFVRLVYSIPTEKETNSVFPHSLQTLFYQLQSRNYHCTTAGLLKSFAWDSSRARIQQDVQEFSCLFIEYLEKNVEKIPQLRGQIKKLFQGQIQSYIKCISVKYESVSEESFFDISLNLKDCADIYASLDDYIREEMLEGDNEYDTGVKEFKKQDAKKGVKLLSLPPVLFFHLKRFHFDVQTSCNVKITDEHKYYDEIDLRKYMVDAKKDQSYKYKLFAVLVHSGEMASSGHYYAYIRPNPEQNHWFKFNDAIVERASKKQVTNKLNLQKFYDNSNNI